MKKIIKGLLSQKIINNFYHLPRAILANIIYGFPTRKLIVIGVTGTDGKTTTTNMIYQILKDAHKKVSMISTINAPGQHVTSPDPFTIQKFAGDALKKQDQYLVLEVTSHALDQFRFWGIKFNIGVITNITHEHLDYHKTFENYKNVKLNFIKNLKHVVVNQNLNIKGVTFGLVKGDFNQSEIKLKLKTPGDYNIENALAALAVAFALNIDKQSAQKSLERFSGLTGRMEEVKNSKGIKIFIDFAHTPNGLQQALKTLSASKKGKIISLIGAEGFRDSGKRIMMGEIAQKLSQIVVVTAVDPRGQLDVINEQIRKGAENVEAKEGVNFFVIDNRQKAIEFAIQNAKPGDTVAIFGKGHETSMNLDGKKEISWSDREAVEKVLENG